DRKMTAAVLGEVGPGVSPGRGGGGSMEDDAHRVVIEGGEAGGVTPLMVACQQGSDHYVRQILTKKPEALHERDRTGKSALHYCAENTTLACIDQVVEAEPELLASKDEDGYSPLHLATIAGNKAVVKYLLAKGADVNALDNEKHTAVHWA
ncbi:unnamed protein product, partial [Meganyctiphanes norvegica]